MSQPVSAVADPAMAAKCELACEALRSFGSLRFQATGWSMLPSLWPGDILFVERADASQVRVGDVVLAQRESRLCAHRVIAISHAAGNWRCLTQGDAMPAPDRPLHESELVGRIHYAVRAGRLLAVPGKLSPINRLTAKVVGHSLFAARALVYFRQWWQTPAESGAPCQV